ncbi:hypothetical protein [Azospirillum griseum]|uniref:Uncharacterized protein n=1 Tax=Azospirillum griseum TaxID=2496639 RepID=A0A3S0KY10_9PROT|nr:hypothetical protein [Azospirillum griseum]RTR19808.1 hypothetical protein EJ903_12460 [Azospirillum griseum]
MIDLPSAINDYRSRGVTSFHARADNVAFEEILSAERVAGYVAHPSVTPDWAEHHSGYVGARINRSGRAVPETFEAINGPAHLNRLDENQFIVRVEAVDWVLKEKGLSVAQLVGWWAVVKGAAKADPHEREEAQDSLDELFDVWNRKRDNRPIFAGFEGDVADDLAALDWPNRLRDRWGLGHYAPFSGQSITVLLMRYAVRDVVKTVAKRGGAAFARPTALDGGLNDWFFSAPKGVSFGRAMDLQPDGNCERHVAEILHQRIDYRVSHAARLGAITAPLPAVSLRQRRNDHLACLQYHSDRDDFGQDIPAHVVD